MKVITKSIPIYIGYFRIVIAKDLAKAFNKLGGKWDSDVNGYEAFVYNDNAKNGVNRHTVYFKPNPAHEIVAHEVVHLVNSLFIDSGVQLDRYNDEPQAYLTGWFVKEIYKALKV